LVERQLLGTILISSGVLAQAESLTEQDFALSAHKLIWRAMRMVAECGEAIDELSVSDELTRCGQLEDLGGLAYLGDLTDGAVARTDISGLMAALQDCAARRKGAKAGEQLRRLSRDASVNTTALFEVAAQFADSAQSGESAAPLFSEDALALRFSRQHADDLRYVAMWGKWFAWDGSRWCEDSTLGVFDRVRVICRRASAECGSREQHVATRLTAGATVASIERLARSDRRHASTVDQWDCDPWLLNTPEGTVDLRTGELGNRRLPYGRGCHREMAR
jgi:hypothetical protein